MGKATISGFSAEATRRTFDENDYKAGFVGLTNPAVGPDAAYLSTDIRNQILLDAQNRIAIIFAGAHVRPGVYSEGKGTHVNILRTIEAMYGLPKSGKQQG